VWIADAFKVERPLCNVAIFGLGSMGLRYLWLLRDEVHADPQRIHLCDTAGHRRVPAGAWNWSDDPHDLLTKMASLDLAIIATPGRTHLDLLAAITERFPTAGVLVEKPLTDGLLSLAGVDLAPALFTRCIAVGYNWRFHPDVDKLARHASSIVDLTLYVADDMSKWPGNYGMPLYEYSHELDLVRVLTRDPTVTSATFSDSGYRIHGRHLHGKWAVRIRNGDVPKGRWVRVRRSDGMRISFAWRTGKEVMDRTYLLQLKNLLHTWGASGRPYGLRCPLAEGVATAQLVDEVARAL